MTIIQGNCLDVLKEYPHSHFSSIITDPPYGLAFMGKKWDYDVPSIEIWKECLRVLKPGGTMLCFAGSRTQHRMAVNIEDSGFVIKDCLMFLYGQGFPKATDISKQLDKKLGKYIPGDISPNSRNSGKSPSGCYGIGVQTKRLSNPQSEEAYLFNGYKSHGLKPAYEPILLAMKPNERSYAENAIKWGVSGINIGESRIGYPIKQTKGGWHHEHTINDDGWKGNKQQLKPIQGRFPSNVLFDEQSSDMLGDKARFFYCAKASKAERNAGCEGLEEKTTEGMRANAGPALVGNNYIRTKMKNNHPTVKPLKLMKYLIKLIMPPKDGILLDPFAGSGSTIVASTSLGYISIGIELDKDYCDIARKRVELEKEKTKQQELF